MKKNILALLISTSIFVGLPAQAHYATKLEHAKVQGTSYESKDDAYKYGLTKIQELQTLSSYQLNKKLSNNIFDKADSSSLKLTNSYVTVKEFTNAEGDLLYKPTINISYTFKYRNN